MGILFLLLIVLLFIPFPDTKSLFKINDYHDDYLAPNTSLPIKGFFVIWVFLRHSLGYTTISNTLLSRVYLNVDSLSGQLIVAVFLFYSGYGVYESIKKNKKQYLKRFPRKRLFRTWFRFAICVTIFLVYNLITNKIYPVETILLSYTAWKEIGNSNWYIFVILVLYALTFIAFLIFAEKGAVLTLIIITVLSVLFIDTLIITGHGYYWYNTIFCYVTGMWYSEYKSKIEKVVQRSNATYYLTLLSLIFIFSSLFILNVNSAHDLIILMSPVLVMIIVIVSMKMKFRSVLLSFFGKHVFSIYMLQRLAFLILENRIENSSLFVISSLLLTTIISVLFDTAYKTIEERLHESCMTKVQS